MGTGEAIVTGAIPIVAWEDLTDEQQTEWVRYLVRVKMGGGETLYEMARNLRLNTAQMLEVRDR